MKSVKAKLATVFGPIDARQVRQLDRGADLETVSYISVNSVNGVVTLTGEVRGKRAKAKAGDIARSVEQVVSVNSVFVRVTRLDLATRPVSNFRLRRCVFASPTRRRVALDGLGRVDVGQPYNHAFVQSLH